MESLHGVGVVVAAHLYGLTASGIVLVAYKAVELAVRFAATGFGDAVVYFGARRDGPEGPEPRLARIGRGMRGRSRWGRVWAPR